VTDATGEMLETFSALFPGVGHGQDSPPSLSLRTSLKRVDSALTDLLKRADSALTDLPKRVDLPL
jgi:hypothetical protein